MCASAARQSWQAWGLWSVNIGVGGVVSILLTVKSIGTRPLRWRDIEQVR
jgi:hypothetical protein